MSAPVVRIGEAEYRQLTPKQQRELHAWITSFFPCDPGRIEWVEFTLDPRTINWVMLINLITPEDPKRPTLVSELHMARVTTLVPDGLLARLVEVAGATFASGGEVQSWSPSQEVLAQVVEEIPAAVKKARDASEGEQADA